MQSSRTKGTRRPLTENTDLQPGQPRLDLRIDVDLSKVDCNGPRLHFVLLLCEGKDKWPLVCSLIHASQLHLMGGGRHSGVNKKDSSQ